MIIESSITTCGGCPARMKAVTGVNLDGMQLAWSWLVYWMGSLPPTHAAAPGPVCGWKVQLRSRTLNLCKINAEGMNCLFVTTSGPLKLLWIRLIPDAL